MKKDFEVHESHVCELLDLDATIASGARWHDLGDGVERNAYSVWPIMFDAKCTVQKSYSVRRDWMRQQVRRAVASGKRFLLPVRFVDEHGQHDDYVVMPLDDFAELLMKVREEFE